MEYKEVMETIIGCAYRVMTMKKNIMSILFILSKIGEILPLCSACG